MDAILKFKEAAKELQGDERYIALQAARKASDEDERLQGQIGEFNLLRLELNNEMSKEARDEDKIMQLNTKVNSMYNDIMSSETMVKYNEAKEGIEKFMEHVNAILNTAIEGGDPMTVEEPEAHACGEEGCSSCSGCH